MLQERQRAVDLGQVTDETGRTELFLNHLGAGFEAAALIESLQMQRLRGFVLYLTAALRVIPRHSRGWEMTVRYNGSAIKRPLNLASVANGGRTGGGFKIAPVAELDDGQLDLIMGHTPNGNQCFAVAQGDAWHASVAYPICHRSPHAEPGHGSTQRRPGASGW